MTLTDLRYLVVLARERHFGHAAERCNVSQPTLSVAIKKLEDELAVTLFERSAADVKITDIGARIVAQDEKVLLEAGQIKELATAGRDPLCGPLKAIAAGAVTAPDGTYRTVPPAAPVRVLSAATAQSMRAMMEGVVVEGGTAVKAAVPGYRVAGKTGTAQRAVKGGYSGYTASFIGMAPAENPALVVAVIVQNPQRGHYGGEVAAPVFRDLMTYALAHQSVTPSTSKPAQIPTTWR